MNESPALVAAGAASPAWLAAGTEAQRDSAAVRSSTWWGRRRFGVHSAPHGGHGAALPSQSPLIPVPTRWGRFWITPREPPVPGCQLARLHGKQLLCPHVLAQQQSPWWCRFPLLRWAGNSGHRKAFPGERCPRRRDGTSGRRAKRTASASFSTLCFYY